MKRVLWTACGWALAGLGCAALAAGCLYDPEHRCGPERILENGVCVCKPGKVDKDSDCVEPAPVTAMPDEDDAGIDAADAGAMPTGGACSSHDECGAGFFCASGTCRALPTGEGQSCESDDDCRSFEASVCTVGSPIAQECVVSNCTEGSCSPGRTCVDVSQYVPGSPSLCIAL